VTAGGSIVNASAADHSIALGTAWGGGNFGVVTEFEFAPTRWVNVNLALFFWSVDLGADVLRYIRECIMLCRTTPACSAIGLNVARPSYPEYQFAPCQPGVVGGDPPKHAVMVEPIGKGFQPFDFVTPIRMPRPTDARRGAP
jgi:hypothetical protein